MLFLQGLLVVIAAILSLSTAAGPNSACSPNSPENPLDVLVIGAGWSGLAAAQQLLCLRGGGGGRNNSGGVCLLEARDEIGGRSRTQMGVFQPGLPTELGSAWIYEDSSIWNIFSAAGLVTRESPSHFSIDDLGLYTYPQTANSTSNSTNSTSGGGGGLMANDTSLRDAYDDFVQFARDRSNPDISMQALKEAYFAEQQTPPDNLQRQTINALVAAMMHSEWGAYIAQANSADMVWSLTPSYTIHFVAVPGGGYQPALDYYAQPLFQNNVIKLNTVVTEIDYTNANGVVRVTSVDRTDNSTNVHFARAVLCTVPLGVLQHGDLRFVPPLPPAKTQAIQTMGMGNKNKCILYWDANQVDVSSWWPYGRLEMLLIPQNDQDSGEWTIFSNDQNQNGNENNYILTSWIGGLNADKWENRTNAETLQRVMQNLRNMFPHHDIPEPTKYVVTRWKSDPFTRGTYTYYKVGVNYAETARALARPVGKNRVYFAGEHTSPYGMSAVSAFWTGVGAARRILNAPGVLLPQEMTTTTEREAPDPRFVNCVLQ